MKITRVCLLETNHIEEIDDLDELMRVWCSALRYSFNRLVEAGNSGDIIKIVQQKFRLNKRYAEDAVLQAQARFHKPERIAAYSHRGSAGKNSKKLFEKLRITKQVKKDQKSSNRKSV